MKRIILLLCIVLRVSFGPEQQIKWIALGDSITYLNDHPDETGNRIVKGYLTRVVKKLPCLQPGDFVDVGFDPDADEYPYPPQAVNMTYDGLHPSDEGNEMIARMLVKMLQKFTQF